MDFQRAQEIFNSADHIQVLHKDKAIWINELNSQSQTAQIAFGPQFQEKASVPVRELEEVNKKH